MRTPHLWRHGLFRHFHSFTESLIELGFMVGYASMALLLTALLLLGVSHVIHQDGWVSGLLAALLFGPPIGVVITLFILGVIEGE